MKTNAILGITAGLAICGLLFWALAPVADDEPVTPSKEQGGTQTGDDGVPGKDGHANANKLGVSKPGKVKEGGGPPKRQRKRPVFVTADKTAFEKWAEGRAPKAAKLARKVAESIDNSDLEGLRALQEEVLKCDDPEIRMQMVEALSWFAEGAVEDMVPYLSDSDDDVQQAAMGHWEASLDKMPEDAAIKAMAKAMPCVSAQKSLDGIGERLAAADDQDEVIKDMIPIVEDKNAAAAEVAKAVYAKITGKEFESEVKARFWLFSRSVNKSKKTNP